MADDMAPLRRWVDRWRRAGPALEQQRRRELRDMTDKEARAAIDAALSLALSSYIPPKRQRYSGLVEQQALFRRLRRS